MKPQFQSVPPSDGLKWSGLGAYQFTEKMDGVFHVRSFDGLNIAGEMMVDGRFFAFGIVGSDPLRLQWPVLVRLASAGAFELPATGCGGEFLEAVLARGGEGVVAKPWDSPFGVGWVKCKRAQVFYGLVTELDANGGRARVSLIHNSWLDQVASPEDFLTGDDGGWLALRSRFEMVRPGSVLKIEAYGQHASGKLREARLDQDAPGSWLVKY